MSLTRRATQDAAHMLENAVGSGPLEIPKESRCYGSAHPVGPPQFAPLHLSSCPPSCWMRCRKILNDSAYEILRADGLFSGAIAVSHLGAPYLIDMTLRTKDWDYSCACELGLKIATSHPVKRPAPTVRFVALHYLSASFS